MNARAPTAKPFRAHGGKNPWSNPSIKAISRVLNPLPKPTRCNCCGGEVRLVENVEIYGKHYGEWPYAFLCQNQKCRAYVGLHPFTDIPLGTLADSPTREARASVKVRFNRIWQEGHMTREDAYIWLAGELKIRKPACHIGWFDKSMCLRAEQVCINYLLALDKKG